MVDAGTEIIDEEAHGTDLGRRSHRGRQAVVATAAVVAVGVGSFWMGGDDTGPDGQGGPQAGQTVAVLRTDLVRSRSLSGTLGFGAPHTVSGHRAGTITWLPEAGAVMERGSQLVRVDDRPVSVFYGALPLYRTLGAPEQASAPQPAPGATGGAVGAGAAAGGTAGAASAEGSANSVESDGGPGTTGADVEMLETNLYALGYREFGTPDDKLTDYTVAAIEHWQKDLGIKNPTGRVGPGDVEVIAGRSRVASVTAHVGDGGETELLSLSGTTRVVSVGVPVGDAPLLARGTKVSVSLPDGSTTDGKVAHVGTVVSEGREGAPGSGEPTLPVTISLGDPKAAPGLEGAPVTVLFTSEAQKGVLAVPVGALVALREGGYALQVEGSATAAASSGDQGKAASAPRLIAVRTGMFAQGLVEVSGPDVKEGLRVVTSQ
ncbi:peptidoglycan-binding protein [Streptomyces sp. SID2888]|uniref:peptidoglycan-binding protein n=1 Tax=Streptomyces sp. SID2888 TaxID=2690256 RepID=UPI001368E8CB|nr:peptidoglycan-binding protein [Streptomyces sp. SID2888]MYV46089.1 peptidoglycan-binding protein [Streptomyces sp. SID2888]